MVRLNSGCCSAGGLLAKQPVIAARSAILCERRQLSGHFCGALGGRFRAVGVTLLATAQVGERDRNPQESCCDALLKSSVLCNRPGCSRWQNQSRWRFLRVMGLKQSNEAQALDNRADVVEKNFLRRCRLLLGRPLHDPVPRCLRLHTRARMPRLSHL